MKANKTIAVGSADEMDGWTNGWMDGRPDGWMDGLQPTPAHSIQCHCGSFLVCNKKQPQVGLCARTAMLRFSRFKINYLNDFL